jgi:hypothetical protein
MRQVLEALACMGYFVQLLPSFPVLGDPNYFDGGRRKWYLVSDLAQQPAPDIPTLISDLHREYEERIRIYRSLFSSQ